MCAYEKNKKEIMEFGDALRYLKEKKKLSLKQISIRSGGLSKSFLSDIINKKVLPPKDEFIIKIAKALNISPEYFYVYRKRRFVELIDENRELLDECIEQIKKNKRIA